MAIDLKNMTRKELEKLGRDVEKALEKMRKQDLKKVRQEMQKVAAAAGVTVEEVMGLSTSSPKPKKAVKAKSVAKYVNPTDKSQTWTGKGRQPAWFKAAIEAGKTPESLAV